jgi:hypothetical protein
MPQAYFSKKLSKLLQAYYAAAVFELTWGHRAFMKSTTSYSPTAFTSMHKTNAAIVTKFYLECQSYQAAWQFMTVLASSLSSITGLAWLQAFHGKMAA